MTKDIFLGLSQQILPDNRLQCHRKFREIPDPHNQILYLVLKLTQGNPLLLVLEFLKK